MPSLKPDAASMDIEMLERVVTAQQTTTPVPRIHVKTIVTLIAICFLCFAQMITIIGSGLLGQSTATLFGDSTKSIWFTSSLTLWGIAGMIMVGQVADYFGRKWITVYCSLFGVIGPIVISRATNMGMIIAGFNLIGPAMATQVTLYAIPSEILHRKHRAFAQASINVSHGAGAIVGIIMGGSLVRDNAEGYRIFWYIAAGIYAIGVLGVVIGYNPPLRAVQAELSLSIKLRRMDFIGTSLLAVSLVLFCIALQWSSSTYSWRDAHVLVPFILSAVIIVAFAFYEWFRNDGLLQHDLFANRNFPITVFIVLIEGIAFWAVNAYLAFEFTVLYDLDQFQSALRLLMVFLGSTVFAGVTGFYTTWTKQLREPIATGFALFAIFFGLMTSIKTDSSEWKPWFYPVVAGSGLGMILVNALVAAQLSTPPHTISVTTSLMGATRSLGGAIGLAINTAIFNGSMTRNVGKKVAVAVLPLGFAPTNLERLISALGSGNRAAVGQVPGVIPQIAAAAGVAFVDSYRLAFRDIWIASAAFSGAGMIVTLFLRNIKAEFNEAIDAPVESDIGASEAEFDAVGEHVEGKR